MHCISLIFQAFNSARLRSWKAQWKYGALEQAAENVLCNLFFWWAIFLVPSYVWAPQSVTEGFAYSNIETISQQTDSSVMFPIL